MSAIGARATTGGLRGVYLVLQSGAAAASGQTLSELHRGLEVLCPSFCVGSRLENEPG
jgi:hypothetical protein